jgi:copper chaperone CopZ
MATAKVGLNVYTFKLNFQSINNILPMNKNQFAKAILAISLLVFFQENSFASAKNTPSKVNTIHFANTADSTIVLSVSEMGCKTDSKMVQTALYRRVGIKKVILSEGTVTVTFNPQKISVKEIFSIIENTGTCEDPNAKVHKVKIKS